MRIFSFPKRSSVLFAGREYAVGASIWVVCVKVALRYFGKNGGVVRLLDPDGEHRYMCNEGAFAPNLGGNTDFSSQAVFISLGIFLLITERKIIK